MKCCFWDQLTSPEKSDNEIAFNLGRLDRESCAAELRYVRPAGGKKNPYVTGTYNDSGRDFRHPHAIITFSGQ